MRPVAFAAAAPLHGAPRRTRIPRGRDEDFAWAFRLFQASIAEIGLTCFFECDTKRVNGIAAAAGTPAPK